MIVRKSDNGTNSHQYETWLVFKYEQFFIIVKKHNYIFIKDFER